MSTTTPASVPAAPPRPTRPCARAVGVHPLTLALALAVSGTPARAADATPKPRPKAEPVPLVVAERTLTQDQGGWRVCYRLRYPGTESLVISPGEMLATVEGWVSNSHVATHATPRWSSVAASGTSGLSGTCDVLSAPAEAQRCRERVTLQVSTDDPTGDADTPHTPAPPALTLAPGASVRLRLRLEHLHQIYGDYDPLLGQRTLEVRLGPAVLHDVLPLDREQYLAQAKTGWPEPPEDRRDNRRFVSAPDSLLLEACVPGNHYYHFEDRPVRYASKMRLRFWYLTARGTEGDCLVRVTQFRKVPDEMRVLSEGSIEESLTRTGGWVRFEKVFRTEAEATELSLDFRLTGDVGAMWIDDVTLEPVAPHGPAGP